MSKVKEIYECTIKLIEILESGDELSRDEKIRVIEDSLEFRENLMRDLLPPFSEKEHELGAQLVDLNKVLAGLLSAEKLLIQRDIKSLSLKKESTNKYANPYQSLATDGMFYDRKK